MDVNVPLGMPVTRVHDSELVAIRAACHYAYLLRGFAEAKRQRIDLHLPLRTHFSPSELDALSKAALSCRRLKRHFSRKERTVIKTSLGRLSPWRAWSSSYRCVPIGLLLWALNVPKHIAAWHSLERNAIGCITPEQAREIGWERLWADRVLRPQSELRRQTQIAEIYAWRTRVHGLTHTIALRRPRGHLGSVPTPPALIRAVERRTTHAVRSGLVKARGGEIVFGSTTLLGFLESSQPLAHAEYAFYELLRTARWIQNPQTSYERTRTTTPLGFDLDPQYFTNLTFIRSRFDPPNRHWAANY
jgi:hypothetical protein